MRLLDNIIKEELIEIKENGDNRRTRIVPASEIDIEDMIAEEDVVITLPTGYIKRTRKHL